MVICEQPPFRVLAPLAFIGHDEALGASARRVFVGLAGGRDIPFTEGVSFWLEVKGLNYLGALGFQTCDVFSSVGGWITFLAAPC
jgi:hypothetical protein